MTRLTIGLVDCIAETRQDLMTLAETAVQKYLKFPDTGRVITKTEARSEFAAQWADPARLESEATSAWNMLSHPTTIKALEKVLARLSKPKM